MSEIIDSWQFPFEPRRTQINAFHWLEDNADKKYKLLESPVGSGKSAIAMTYSQHLHKENLKADGDSYILTPQRILQDQYADSVRTNQNVDLASFYGRSNYKCKSKYTTCDIGALIKPGCKYCPFKEARDIAIKASDTVMNYTLALTSFTYTDNFEPRTLMSLDECHTLEHHLVNFDALKIMKGRCKKYKLPYTNERELQTTFEWLRSDYLTELKAIVVAMDEECEYIMEKDHHSGSDVKKLKEFNQLQSHYDDVVMLCLRPFRSIQSNFVLSWDKDMFEFKRITGEYSFHKILKPMAHNFLMMSSTILNAPGFCRDLGIPKDEVAFLSLPSEFDVKNRSVVYMPQTKMNAQWKGDGNIGGRRRIISTIEKITDMHVNDSGIIHSGNFEIAKWLVDNLDIEHQIYHHNPGADLDRNEVIEAFQDDHRPSILISPSSTEGLDLKDDLGRFAIFAKIPFGYLGDNWIKKRMNMSDEWYKRRALIDVIQGGGRIVRSDTDFGQVYILDQSWGYLYQSSNSMIPKWWIDAYNVL